MGMTGLGPVSLERPLSWIGQIPTELRKLLDDCKFGIANGTNSPDEIATRFKHRIVQIHCFSNGNGRHSRMMGDLIIEKIFGRAIFSSGKNSDLTKVEGARVEYLKAERAADVNDLARLLTSLKMF
jgi:fido (protein-threonine AMPylation protein)